MTIHKGISASILLRRISLCSMSVLCFAVGCASKQDFAEVEGVVMLEGTPLPNVLVQFHPESTTDPHYAPSSEHVTDEHGRFRLYCPQRQREGAIIGVHRVCVIDLNVKDSPAGGSNGNKPRFSLDYSRTDATDLRQEVKPGAQSVEVRLTRKVS